ncbi:hypothetical protein D1122_02735 [Cereibacter sphaeroides]|nr:hypothetical protein D1122_02735 [Cereibacter sphaeroides]
MRIGIPARLCPISRIQTSNRCSTEKLGASPTLISAMVSDVAGSMPSAPAARSAPGSGLVAPAAGSPVAPSCGSSSAEAQRKN